MTPFGGTAVLTGTLLDVSDVPIAIGGQPEYVWSSPNGAFPGTRRVRANAPADAKHAATRSPWSRTFKVK